MKKKLVVLSGAGISAESGLKTFRSSDGLWEEYPIESVATPSAWRANPDLVHTFYNLRRAQIINAKPNFAHEQLAQLEAHFNVSIVTQNIDDLHERAGSTSVLHLHGNIRFSKSSGPNQEKAYYPIHGATLSITELCPDGYPLRPHVVWFGENVPLLQTAADIISSADILLVIGTSLTVYPAAGLIGHASENCQRYIIDPDASQLNGLLHFNRIPMNATEGIVSFITAIKKGS
jgi:NAD-dependent deacetylase